MIRKQKNAKVTDDALISAANSADDSPTNDDADSGMGKPADSTGPSVKITRKRKRRRRRRKKSSVKEKVYIVIVLTNCKGYNSKQGAGNTPRP